MLPWRRHHDDEDGPDAEIVELRPDSVAQEVLQGEIEIVDPDEIEEYDETGTELEPWSPSSALAQRLDAIAARPIVLPREHLAAAAKWHLKTLWRNACWVATHPLHPPLHELRPVIRGVRVTWLAWRDWVTEAELADAIDAAPKDSASRLTLSKQRAEARSGHRRMSFLVALLLTIAVGVTYVFWPLYLAAAGLAGLVVFDIVGRRHPDLDAPPPPRPRTPLEAGAPLGALTSTVVDRLREEGLRVDPAGGMRIHEGCEYRIDLMHEDAIKQEHLRSLERHLAARPMSIRLINNGRDAGISELRMQTQDPLAGARIAEWIPTGSISCLDYLPLGRATGEQPCALRLVGVHVAVVGRTRSGKTESALWTIIDRLSACRDAVIWGVDLQNGPAFPMWRGVIQEVAYTPEEAEALFALALDEIVRRMKVLRGLAESDDDDEAGSTWTPDLGHYLFIVIDEFALTVAYNGEKDMKEEPNLVRPIKDIIRVGLKVGVHLILASQKTGNSDFGDSVISSQVSTKIVLACKERDTTTMLSLTQRDQGWAPHLLQPFQSPEDPRDAGVAYIESPVHNLPERYKFDYWPPGEVKRRARQRLADGLPSLDDSASNVIDDAVEVPEILVKVKATFARLGHPELAPTAEILADLGKGWDSVKLAEKLKPFGMASDQKRINPKANAVRGYLRDDLDRALRSL